MVTLKVRVTFDEEVLGTASGNPEVHREYIASNAPDAASIEEEVAAIGTEGVFEKAMTVFPKENGKPFVFDYQWRGAFKDSFAALRKIPDTACSKIKAYKKEIDGLLFVSPRKIPIIFPEGIDETEMGICQRPLRASTPQGERVALASSETIPAGSSMEFEIKMLIDSLEKPIMEALEYGKLRGFGQWRNSGKGIFHYEILERNESKYGSD